MASLRTPGISAVVGSFVGPVSQFFGVTLGRAASAIAMGQPLTSYTAIGSAVVLTIVFLVAALWRFSRDEL